MAESRTDRNLPADAAGYYDTLAGMGIYDELAHEADWPAKADRLIQRIFTFKDPATVKTALDLGAGTGHSIDAIKRHADPSRTVAVDISPGMLERLGAKYMAPEVEAVRMSTEDYVAGSKEQFDLITAMSILEFVPDLPQVLGLNIARLLGEDGVFAATYVPQGSGGTKERLIESEGIDKALQEYYWQPEDIEQSHTSQGLAIIDRVDGLAAYSLDEEVVRYNFLIAGRL